MTLRMHQIAVRRHDNPMGWVVNWTNPVVWVTLLLLIGVCILIMSMYR